MSAELVGSLVGTIGGLLGSGLSVWASVTASNVKREMQVRLLEPRLAAYKSLWSLMSVASPSLVEAPPMQDRVALEERLRGWYYCEGNGIFLSRAARALLVDAKKQLAEASTPFSAAVQTLSALRSQMKNDVAVYGKEDVTAAHHI